jgi:hypothetical protein
MLALGVTVVYTASLFQIFAFPSIAVVWLQVASVFQAQAS